MECESEYNVDAAGDRRICGSEHSSDWLSPPLRRRLNNGVMIPVFTAGERLNEASPDITNDEFFAKHNKGNNVILGKSGNHYSSTDIVKEFLACPICNDPVIEATSTNCGHKFCRECIDTWRRKKPVCPVCSSLVTSQHRLFSDDQLIESQLDCLPPDVKTRFFNAQRKRLEILHEERKSQTLLKSVRKKLNDSLTYLRSKSISSLGDNFSSLRSALSSCFSNSTLNYVMLGLIILTLACLCASGQVTFLQYMWLATKSYNGTIPDHWLHDYPDDSDSQGEVEVECTYMDKFIEAVNTLSWGSI